MSFGDEIDKEFKALLKKRDRLVKSASLNLFNNLVKVSPSDTGELRKSWQLPERMGTLSWRITNIAPHAIIIDGGRREVVVNGKMKEIGSKQLEDGFKPTVDETKKKLQKEFNKL